MGVQAWASIPVHSPDGQVIGSFCVGDTRVREWSRRETEILEALAAAASTEIALRDAAANATTLARTLPDSVLPPSVPTLPGFTVVTDYCAAEDGTKLVGDFFESSNPLAAAGTSPSATWRATGRERRRWPPACATR